jgi:hypothetical protein
VRPADRALIGLGVAVTAYEAAALVTDWELLTVAIRRHRDRRPVLTVGAITFLAAHLIGVWPPRLDPLHRLAEALSPCGCGMGSSALARSGFRRAAR